MWWSAIYIKAAEICVKNAEGQFHLNKLKGSTFQEKFCFQAHRVVQRCMSKAIEEFKAEVQSVTQSYKDKTKAEFHSKKLHWAWYVKPDSKYTSNLINNLYMHTQIYALNWFKCLDLHQCFLKRIALLWGWAVWGSHHVHFKADFFAFSVTVSKRSTATVSHHFSQ